MNAILRFCSFVLMLGLTSVSAEELLLPPPQDRSIAQIEIHGVDEIPADVVRDKLANLPEVVEALHHSIDESVYQFRVQDAVSRGFRSSGFLKSQVTVADRSRVPGEINVTVVEGPRYRRGQIRVSGGSEEVNAWVTSQLEQLKTKDKKDPKLVWQPGKPACGTLFGQLGLVNAFRDCLNSLGLAGTLANIELTARDEDLFVDVVIELAKRDATIVVPKTAEANGDDTDVSDLTSPSNDTSIAARLATLYQEYFDKPQSGFVVNQSQDKMRNQCWFGSTDILVRSSSKADQTILAILVGPNEFLLRIEQSGESWRLPGPKVSMVLEQRTLTESAGASTLNMKFSWSVSTNKNAAPSERGFRFTREAWQQWFPVDKTTITKTPTGEQFVFADRRIDLDTDGQLIRLSGLDESGERLEVVRVSDEDIARAAASLIPETGAKEILVRDGSGDRAALGKVLAAAFSESGDKSEFFIPAAGGQKDLWGALTLMVVNGESFVRKESLIARLATLYALELSGHRRTLSARIEAIEAEALGGPLTAMALADLAQRAGLSQRAMHYHTAVLQLTRSCEAVTRDIELLVDEENLIGQIAENVDIKVFLQLFVQLANTAEGSTDLSWVVELIHVIPDAESATTRRENAQRLARVVYESSVRPMLETRSQLMLQQLAKHQAKKEEKQAKKK